MHSELRRLVILGSAIALARAAVTLLETTWLANVTFHIWLNTYLSAF